MKKTVLFICGAQGQYTRNEVIVKSLKYNFNVIEITSNKKSYLLRLPIVIIRYLINFKKYDIIFVGFYGQLLVPIVRLFSKKPIIFDAFISTYDTLCFDRKLFKPESIVGKISYYVDKLSCELADKVLLDTNAHIGYFVRTFNLPEDKFHRIFVGANENIFYPRNLIKKSNDFIVLYYGTYLPLQGIEYIIKAAKLLEQENDIKFIIIGKGMEKDKIIKLSTELKLRNIEFIDWIPYNELPLKIAEADICLGGHFSNIDKGQRVIAGKTFQFIAMKKPVIVGDNPANRELFENRKNALMVETANADALAEAILELKENKNLIERISNDGYKIFMDECTSIIIGKNLANIAEELVGN